MSNVVIKTDDLKALLLKALQESHRPISIQEAEEILEVPSFSVKEAAWKLVEEGKAVFDSNWLLVFKNSQP